MSEVAVRHRFTADEYMLMVDAGILHEDSRVELIEGEVLELSPINSPHHSRVDRLNAWFAVALQGRAHVRVQGAVRLGDLSRPEPDLLLFPYRADFYAHGDAKEHDVLLAVEVSDSSLRFDRTVKRPLYARFGIPEMWIVDIAGRTVEVATDPAPDGYGSIVVHGAGDVLSPRAFPDISMAVDELLF